MDRLGNRGSRRDPALKRARRRFKPPRSLRATRPGWCFIAIIFGVGFAALNTGNNLLYLVFALMLAFLVLSGILSETSLRGIRVERSLPREIFAGASNPVRIRIWNRQPRVAAFALSVEDRLVPQATRKGSAQRAAGRCFVLRVGPDSVVDRSYALVPERRGELELASLRVSTRFPFGLFVKSVEIEAPESALVYPALVPIGSAAAAGGSRHETDQRPGRSPVGDALVGVREFVQGDRAARVHWRRSLRSGRLVVGEREGQTAAEVEILLLFAADASPAANEARISFAASELVHHLEAGHRVGLRTRTVRFAPSTGPGHRRELLAFLARIDPGREALAVDVSEESSA
ncbi:MAG: DUF58 domain-containing protein [Myxococcota bacterium]